MTYYLEGDAHAAELQSTTAEAAIVEAFGVLLKEGRKFEGRSHVFVEDFTGVDVVVSFECERGKVLMTYDA